LTTKNPWAIYLSFWRKKNPRVYIEKRGKERQKKIFFFFLEIPEIRIIQKFECIIYNFPNLDFFPGIGKYKREGISKNLDDILHPIFILHLLLKLCIICSQQNYISFSRDNFVNDNH